VQLAASEAKGIAQGRRRGVSQISRTVFRALTRSASFKKAIATGMKGKDQRD
jgi:hypothetical protein